MMPERFIVDIPEARLTDLRERLARTRLPHDFANDDWSYGTNLKELAHLVDHWRDRYDWRAQEAAINRFDHYRTEVDGIPIHFIRAAGRGPRPIPLILSHGWPWTFWDMHKVIGPLTDPAAYGGDAADAFELIVPSMPGFGFSTPLTKTGVNCWTTADIWHTLMTKRLGFSRYAAAGGDWGALTTAQLGHKYAASLYGVHLATVAPFTLFNHERPWDITAGHLAPPEYSEAERAAYLNWQARVASHVCVQVLDPQTLAYGLHDSPVGLLAWLLERRHSWGDVRRGLENAFDRDFLITTAMIYWLTDSFVTSARFYAEAARHPWMPSHDRMPLVEAATGISRFVHDGTSGVAAGSDGLFNVVQDRTHMTGGHFAHVEAPEAIVDDLRSLFRPLR